MECLQCPVSGMLEDDYCLPERCRDVTRSPSTASFGMLLVTLLQAAVRLSPWRAFRIMWFYRQGFSKFANVLMGREVQNFNQNPAAFKGVPSTLTSAVENNGQGGDTGGGDGTTTNHKRKKTTHD